MILIYPYSQSETSEFYLEPAEYKQLLFRNFVVMLKTLGRFLKDIITNFNALIILNGRNYPDLCQNLPNH